MKTVALIPARAGSRRVPGKNLRLLNGHPLIAYTIAQALAADCDEVLISTESPTVHQAVRPYLTGRCRVIGRPVEWARDESPDYFWVRHALEQTDARLVAILRPTSPFRKPGTIRQALDDLVHRPEVDSLRAVRDVTDPVQKMWYLHDGLLTPVVRGGKDHRGLMVPWHSSPTQAFQTRFVLQTSALEVLWRRTVFELRSISGQVICPFWMRPPEDETIDTLDDWHRVSTMAEEVGCLISPVLTN